MLSNAEKSPNEVLPGSDEILPGLVDSLGALLKSLKVFSGLESVFETVGKVEKDVESDGSDDILVDFFGSLDELLKSAKPVEKSPKDSADGAAVSKPAKSDCLVESGLVFVAEKSLKLESIELPDGFGSMFVSDDFVNVAN